MKRGLRVLGCVVFAWVSVHSGPVVGTSPVKEDPLRESLRIAYDGEKRIKESIRDYTCTLTRRERVEGRLMAYETMFVKIRHQQKQGGSVVEPFSVYVRFLAPDRVKGREVIYVEGQNEGKLIVRNGGTRFEHITTSLLPDSPAAMQQTRYPITEIGMLNLTRRLIERGEQELKDKECQVKLVRGAKINGRPSTVIQVAHTTRQSDLQFKTARIMIDDELNLPVHYSAYDWPEKEGEPVSLLEEYTYTDVKLNVGLTDLDFDHRNEAYRFLKTYSPKAAAIGAR
ncbi:MAG: DUF1571 domain-containing protein [Pirellulaceae bacterium]|nr:DUF1571 domain-containing protein [Pirellulaceae bacterium]MCU0978818.1 DUF1571 domain-containing protein [Pirellulaceae bacterium]